MLTQRTAIALRLSALLTAIVGVVNLVSAVAPHHHSLQGDALATYLPFEVRAGGRLFAALSGFVLLTLANNLLRRKRIAWYLAMGWLALSIVSHIGIGPHSIGPVLLSALLMAQLLWLRTVFTAQSDRPSVAQGVRVLLGALLFTLAYGTIGFYLLDWHYGVVFNWYDALVQTLAMFFTEDNAGLQPQTRLGEFFANSIYIIGAMTLVYALWLLLRPVLLRGAASDDDWRRAVEVVKHYGHTSLARFALFKDKSFYFSPSGRSVVAYVAKGRGAIALGDPIGPMEDRSEAIAGFREFCVRNDWLPAFYQTLPDDLDLYRALGFQSVKIGEEAVVDLKEFSLKGKSKQNLRTAINKFTREGFTIEYLTPPIADALLHDLRIVSNEWLKLMHGAEKKFSVGWFDEDYLRESQVVVVRSPAREIVAFANGVPEYQHNGITLDLMRHRETMPHGTMDFLFASTLQHFKEEGYDSFTLGLSALAGLGDSEDAKLLEQGLRVLYQHMNQFYNFKGLHAYKEKFAPDWQPRYLVFPGLRSLPDVVISLVRADSGDRLLDYFKPGA